MILKSSFIRPVLLVAVVCLALQGQRSSAQEPKLRATLRYREFVFSVAFSADGKTLASGSRDGTIKLWEVATGKELLTIKGHTGGVHSVGYSPDGRTLASGSLDEKTIKLWDVATGKEKTTLKGQTDLVGCVAYSPDGKTLVSASGDKTIRLWDVATGTRRMCGGAGSWT